MKLRFQSLSFLIGAKKKISREYCCELFGDELKVHVVEHWYSIGNSKYFEAKHLLRTLSLREWFLISLAVSLDDWLSYSQGRNMKEITSTIIKPFSASA